MGEPRREHGIWFRRAGGRHEPMSPSSTPRVSYRDRDELRRAVATAARWKWPHAKSRVVEVKGRWQECRGTVYVSLTGGAGTTFEFGPVVDREQPAQAQARESGVRR